MDSTSVEDSSSSFTRPDFIYCIRGMLVTLSNERFLLVVNELEWQRQNKPLVLMLAIQ